MNRIFVTGGEGFFSSRFSEHYRDKYEITAPGRRELDIRDKTAVRKAIADFNPDMVIHTAAMADTKECENNRESSYEINVIGSRNLAKVCGERDCKLIYLSTEQLYNGNVEPGPYSEEHVPCPNTVYGKHKLEAEDIIKNLAPKSTILRLTWQFGMPEKNKKINVNIMWKVIKAALKSQQISLPANEYRGMSYVYELIYKLPEIMELPYDTYNTGSENNLSTYDTGSFILKCMGLEHRIPELLIRDSESYSERPRDIRISNEKLKGFGINFSTTEEAVLKCIEDYNLHI